MMHSLTREQAIRQIVEGVEVLLANAASPRPFDCTQGGPTPSQGEGAADAMLTVVQVAERLSISKTHAYGLINRREVPSVLIGGAVRVSEADLAGYVASCRRVRMPDEEFDGVAGFLREVT